MAETVRLQAKILQVHDVDTPRTVGYGASHRLSGPARIATVAVGYADGYLRSLGNRGFAHIDGVRVAVVGRVSMDLITLDVSALTPEQSQVGAPVDVLGGATDIDLLAQAGGTLAYELLTRLGPRYRRIYQGQPHAAAGAASLSQAAGGRRLRGMAPTS
jgi:alanine racemase